MSEFWLPTYSGRHIDILEPREDDVCLMDIAHHLAEEPRFGGGLIRHYGVAEHSVRMMLLMKYWGEGVESLRETLFHDATEAYLKDLPRPIKILIPQYRELEEKHRLVIYHRYRLGRYEPRGSRTENVLLARLDACIPVVEAQYAGLHLHPESLPIMYDKTTTEDAFLQLCYEISTKQQPTWGWSSGFAKMKFIEACRWVGVWDDSLDVEPGAWSTKCNKCGEQVEGRGRSGRCSRCKNQFTMQM